MEAAQYKWQRLRDYKLLADVIEGVKFKNDERIEDQPQDTTGTDLHQI